MKARRRSMLFCPASEPKLYVNAPIYQPDCLIFDLEDSISAEEKDTARDLLCEAVRTLNFKGIEIFVRINSLDSAYGKDDVLEILKAGVSRIRLPMCESRESVLELDDLLTEVERKNRIQVGSTKIQCAIETPKGVLNAYEIVSSSKRIVAVSFGAEDYTHRMGTFRTAGAKELTYARQVIPIVAAAAGIDSIDTVWSNISDTEGFLREVRDAKELGFTGKSCVHPSQVRTVHQVFSPSEREIQEAMMILQAMEDAPETGVGVLLVDGKMVDAPIISKAKKTIQRAMEFRCEVL